MLEKHFQVRTYTYYHSICASGVYLYVLPLALYQFQAFPSSIQVTLTNLSQ